MLRAMLPRNNRNAGFFFGLASHSFGSKFVAIEMTSNSAIFSILVSCVGAPQQ